MHIASIPSLFEIAGITPVRQELSPAPVRPVRAEVTLRPSRRPALMPRFQTPVRQLSLGKDRSIQIVRLATVG